MLTHNVSLSDLFTICFTRDSYTCQDCGSKDELVIHHKLPISQGGSNDLENLKTVCRDCHKSNYKDTHYPKNKSVIVAMSDRVKTRHGFDKNKITQCLVTFPNDLLEEIEQYWHDKRIMNRNEAIRQLIAAGLKAEAQE